MRGVEVDEEEDEYEYEDEDEEVEVEVREVKTAWARGERPFPNDSSA